MLAKRALDIGAQSLLFPYVQNAEEAQTRGRLDALSAAGHSRRVGGRARQPLWPHAGLSRPRPTTKSACWCRSRPAPRSSELEAIATVDGVDGVFIGPSDLAASLGHLGNPQHPEVQAAIKDAVTRLKKVGKPAGMLTGNEEEARRYIDWGYLFVAVGADVGLLAQQCRRACQEVQTG